MSNILVSVILSSAMALIGTEASQKEPPAKPSQQPLEIRVTEPPHWKNGCLKGTIERVNHSTDPIFLPVSNGLFVEVSVLERSHDFASSESERWLPAYGPTDAIILDVIRLAPGEAKRNHFCVGPTISISSMQKKTRREIPLRGRLRFRASYYASLEEWQISKAQRQNLVQSPLDKSKTSDTHNIKSATLEMPIPCSKAACAPGCNTPPIILDDEKVWVPDVMRNDEAYNTRGRALNEEMAKQFPQCPD